MTNFSFIKKMSKDRVAEFIKMCEYRDTEKLYGSCEICDSVTDKDCAKCRLEWLKTDAYDDWAGLANIFGNTNGSGKR